MDPWHDLVRNLFSDFFDFARKLGVRAFLRQPDNRSRRAEAPKILADDENRRRICHHISLESRKDLIEEEWEIKVIKVLVTVLVEEQPGSESPSSRDAMLFAFIAYQLLQEGADKYCEKG